MAGVEGELYQEAFGAEQSVIGSMLLDGKTVGLAVSELDEADFTLEACRMLFRAFRTLYFGDKPLDPVSVTQLAAPEDAAMRRYAVELMDRTATAANISVYIRQVKERTLRLHLRGIGRELMELEANEAALPLLARGMDLLSRQGREDEADMEQSVLAFYRGLERTPEYLPWGFSDLDEGLYVERGDFVVLAGRPSDGKTALALQMAYAQAEKLNVGFFSLETSREELIARLMSSVSRVSSTALRKHKLSEEEFALLASGSEDLRRRRLTVVEAYAWTAEQIAARTLARKFDVIYVDYLQMIRPTHRGRSTRNDEVADISRTLAELARAHKITVVALSQLSRPGEKGKRRPPVLADLRESGQIEQDADAVLFVWRKDEGSSDADRTLTLAKNKKGRLNNWPLVFRGDIQRFIAVSAPGGSGGEPPRRGLPEQVTFRELRESGDLPF